MIARDFLLHVFVLKNPKKMKQREDEKEENPVRTCLQHGKKNCG